MDLEQDDWIDNQDSKSMILDGNKLTRSMSVHLHTYTNTIFRIFFHGLGLCYRTRGRAGSVQEGSDVLLRPGAEESRQAESRRAGGAAEEPHRHLRGAAVEERLQRQRHHPAVCRCFLSRLFRLKLNLAQLSLRPGDQ